MKLGYSIGSAYESHVSPNETMQRILDTAATASEAGYDYIQIGDHHAIDDGGYLQNVPTAARLTEICDHIALLYLLPLHDPLLVAEQAGTVAAFADEFELWGALGWRDAEFDAYDIPMAERVPRFEESLALLDRVWTDDDVDFDGKFYQIDGVSVNPKATLERVVIGGHAEPAVRRAGRLGDAWVASPTATSDELAERISWVREAGGGDILVRRDALGLADSTRARERAADLLADGYRGWSTEESRILAGGPDDIANQLTALADLGVDEVVIRPMDTEHAEETVKTVAEACTRL